MYMYKVGQLQNGRLFVDIVFSLSALKLSAISPNWLHKELRVH